MVSIRKANLEDGDLVRSLIIHLLEDTQPFGMDAEPSEENANVYWEVFIRPAINSGRGSILIAEDAGDIVGGLFWPIIPTPIKVREEYASGLGVYVVPEYRGNGIAKSLRSVGLNDLKNQGISYVLGFVHTTNASGINSVIKSNASSIGSMLKIPTNV